MDAAGASAESTPRDAGAAQDDAARRTSDGGAPAPAAPAAAPAPSAPSTAHNTVPASNVYSVPRVPSGSVAYSGPGLRTPTVPHSAYPRPAPTAQARPWPPPPGTVLNRVGVPPTYTPPPHAAPYVPRPPGTYGPPRPPAPQPPKKPKPSSHANRAKNVALSALTGGSIGMAGQDVPPPGFLTAGGGARKVLPELVLPFALPTIGAADDEESEPLEKSLVLLQALRQTRMMHMLQVLPPFSHRQRSGIEHFDLVPRALLQGIDPHKPHTLMPLGRADVRVGPMVYYGVRFWELRASVSPNYAKPRPKEKPRYGMVQYPASVRPPPGEGYIRSHEGYIRPPSYEARPRPGLIGTPPGQPASAESLAPGNATHGAPRPVGPSDEKTAAGSGAGSSSASAAPGTAGVPSTAGAPGGSPRGAPASAPSGPPVSGTGAQTGTAPAGTAPDAPSGAPPGAPPGAPSGAASGAASPDPPTSTAPAAPSTPSASTAPSTSSPPNPGPSNIPPRPNPPRPLDAGFLARLQQRAEHDTHLQNLLQLARTGQLPESALPQLNAIIASLMVPPPARPEENGPPVVLVEFPENPSINFVLPLWHMAVERRRNVGARRGYSVLLSFFLPAIGSKAAGDSGLSEAEHMDRGMLFDASLRPKEETPTPAPETPPTPAPAPDTTPDSAKRGGRTKRPKPKKEAAPEPAHPQRGHELYPATWYLRADTGIDERLWDCLGRVPGCVTSEPGRERQWASSTDREVHATLQESFAARFKTVPPTHPLPHTVAKASIPQGLEDHVCDRYAMRIQSSATRPQPKRKVATLSDTKDTSRPSRIEHVPRNYFAEDGEARPKRKRHVATHNPDGSIKSCGACGKTKTPMWRRGPKGPSQLCNACGAKWKAGRLVVPEAPPPPILDDTLPVRRIAQPTVPPAAATPLPPPSVAARPPP